MWPFEKHVPAVDLAAITAPTQVDVEVCVASPNDVTSPITGMRGAAFVVEVVASAGFHTTAPLYETVASFVVGDRLDLRATGGDASIVAMVRRMQLVFRTERTGGHPITSAPAELVPFLARIPFGATPCFREHVIEAGDRMRLRAVVERTNEAVPSAFRTATRSVLVVRPDLGPAVLEELFEHAF